MSELLAGEGVIGKPTAPRPETLQVVSDLDAYMPLVQPLPETDQFVREVSSPTVVTKGGLPLGVFHLNTHEEGTPVMICLGAGDKAQVGGGRAELNAFSQHIQRPIVVIDTPGIGASRDVPISKLRHLTFRSVAERYLETLDSLEISQLDLVAYSLGCLIATKLAENAGEQVQRLVTISSPAFRRTTAFKLAHAHYIKDRRDYHEAVASASPAVRAEIDQIHANRKSARKEAAAKGRAKALFAIMRYGLQVRHPHMSGLATKLPPHITWTDMTGADDAYSDWHDHVLEVQNRNEQQTSASRSTVVDHESHAWLAVRRWEIAAMTAAALEK